jgi:hypothetical protein
LPKKEETTTTKASIPESEEEEGTVADAIRAKFHQKETDTDSDSEEGSGSALSDADKSEEVIITSNIAKSFRHRTTTSLPSSQNPTSL